MLAGVSAPVLYFSIVFSSFLPFFFQRVSVVLVDDLAGAQIAALENVENVKNEFEEEDAAPRELRVEASEILEERCG